MKYDHNSLLNEKNKTPNSAEYEDDHVGNKNFNFAQRDRNVIKI